MSLHTYLPQDRLRALAGNETLPDRTHGTSLFADVSGFTALTEALRQTLGTRHGAEELTRHLDAVYNVLIGEIERFGGSVIGFAGDSITSWFDMSGGPSEQRAVACAFALQAAMRAFSSIYIPGKGPVSLSVKILIASGPARRFVVGDPEIQLLDTLAGATVARMSSADHLAQKGNILLDEYTAMALEPSLVVREWRQDPENPDRFALVEDFSWPVQPPAPASIPMLSNEQLKMWIHRPVFDREVTGQGAFLTEFRPCVALFVRFSGIDFESDSAGDELDVFIRNVQKTATRYEATLIDITIGDKGCYLYINLGALSAHEDEARRAVKIALELQADSGLQLQSGIAQGTMRVGAFGGETRQAYGALGDDVNLAARLMQTAASGEILVSGQLYKAAEKKFSFEPRPPLPMKGMSEPLPVYAVTGEREQRSVRLQEPTYTLPMVGRRAELQLIGEKLELTRQGKSQVIGIVAEPGVGKSRLVAEVVRLANKKGFAGYGGMCQSDGINTPYLVWKPVFFAFFDLDASAPLRRQIRTLEGAIDDLAPDRRQSLPLLGDLLDLEIPQNEFTHNLEPEYRQTALRVLLEDCLRTAARDEPLLIVIEDLHWIDPLSHDLCEYLAKVLFEVPVCFILAYRPPNLPRLEAPRLEVLPNYTRIDLKELDIREAEQAIRAKLALLYPSGSASLPQQLVNKLMARAQGNPFFLEELLNYLHDRGLNPRDATALEQIELPDSLHTLILSRIDQLTSHEKMSLRVASIIGRSFRAAWLTDYYPGLGTGSQVMEDLEVLSRLDITPIDLTETELIYLFKHIVTHEVTYESMPFGLRARLHEMLAKFLEASYSDDPPLDALAFHYSRSENLDKKKHYLLRAAEAAFSVYSNEAALDYYNQALELPFDAPELIEIHLKTGGILEMLGSKENANAHFRTAYHIASSNNLSGKEVESLIKIANSSGDYQVSLEWLLEANELARKINDPGGICDTLNELSNVYWRLGDLKLALQNSREAREIARVENFKQREALADFFTATIYAATGDFAASHRYFDISLAATRELNDTRQVVSILFNNSTTYYLEGNYPKARELVEESLNFFKKIGDKRRTILALNNLGNTYFINGDYQAAWGYYQDALSEAREISDRHAMSLVLSTAGICSFQQGRFDEAEALYKESIKIATTWHFNENLGLLYCYLGLLALVRGKIEPAREHFREGLNVAFSGDFKSYTLYNLIGFAAVALEQKKLQASAALLGAVDANARSMGFKIELELEGPFERTRQAAIQAMGSADFETAWRLGEMMSLVESVDFAGREVG